MKQPGIFPIKFVDFIIILIALGLIFFSAWAAYAKPQNTVRVLIRGGSALTDSGGVYPLPEQNWIFPLDAVETVEVSGPLGITIVKIQGKAAWVESSPCANQTCVAAGLIRKRGQWTACLPNNVFLAIEGNEVNEKNETGNEPDSIAW